jgi:outer membrane lipoprotein SlyB
MRHGMTVLALAGALALAGCSTPDATTGERTLTGAGVGAAAGAAVGLLSGGLLVKTATGAVAGAAGGFVYDQIKKQQAK